MVIAIVALIAALGGSAIAASALNKKKVNSIITNRAAGLSVLKAKTADSATNATNATHATTADRATNVLFARVTYTTATPSIGAQSGGISGAGESFLGAANIVFPRDMSGCSITATGVSGGNTLIIRQSSSLSAGATVVFVLVDNADTNVRGNFNLVAVC